ncbi:hypothetical protein GUITHDRAFT_111488 [Guillardia theta CCMP2712]|uniref:Uncharacterized protein n=1 Tax=Guillardia theta (strain CCMP2712) TaxID=905079 RepID=L1J1V4_GUITC|nr:hypothetical protein GUITHDRAFT_111488 [Guillardia theta CCMP2712]EKX42513.1 hypothetical protein GUITHDRAFT_111488 [Guillardia theta CCMP2712]|eukprot:XP_005829493.1 hypothetical protein GUITHDRAFT_111488 [Guillardia theta CCMP2712]
MENVKRYSGGFGGSMRPEPLQDASSEWVDGLDPGNVEFMMHDSPAAQGSQAPARKNTSAQIGWLRPNLLESGSTVTAPETSRMSSQAARSSKALSSSQDVKPPEKEGKNYVKGSALGNIPLSVNDYTAPNLNSAMLPIVSRSRLSMSSADPSSPAMQPATELEEDETAAGSGGHGLERGVEVSMANFLLFGACQSEHRPQR